MQRALLITVSLWSLCGSPIAHAGPHDATPGNYRELRRTDNPTPANEIAMGADLLTYLYIVHDTKRAVGPYSAFDNCTAFSSEFHEQCNKHGVPCRSVGAQCQGGTAGHRFNAILYRGRWFLVDPQSGQRAPGGSPTPEAQHFPPSDLCEMMVTPLAPDGKCPCTIHEFSETRIPVNTNPVTYCALDPGVRNAPFPMTVCLGCCEQRRRTFEKLHSDRRETWFSECNSACYTHYRPVSETISACTGTSFFSASSRAEQCRSCCFDKTTQGDLPRDKTPNCLRACREL